MGTITTSDLANTQNVFDEAFEAMQKTKENQPYTLLGVKTSVKVVQDNFR